MHADEERRVAAGLEVSRIAGPLVLHDELAVRIELLRNQRVPAESVARAVAVHDDDLGRAARLRSTDGGVDLLGVELSALFEHRLAGVRLLGVDDPGDALHIADDVDAHGGSVSHGWTPGCGESECSSPALPAGSALRARASLRRKAPR